MNPSGIVYLIPTTLGDTDLQSILPANIQEVINSTSHYIVENTRTARRFLIKAGLRNPVDSLTFFEIDKHNPNQDYHAFLKPALNGQNVGIVSEAGCPAVADPGADFVKIAHSLNLQVKPLVGPSSILLAIMASGLNGQSFAFNGYLPVKNPDKVKALKMYENRSRTEKQTQIFIETPYRNLQLFEDLVTNLPAEARLCIAADLTLETEFIKTKKVKEWKGTNPPILKKPCIFLFLV